jgi:glutathione S-transferase
MADQLLPPPDLAPSLPPGLSVRQRIELWLELMDAADAFVLAGLRRRIGPDGDLKAAYREWLAEHMKDHDAAMMHMVEEFNRRTGGHVK